MKRTYKEGLPHHVYSRGVNGNIIFYTRKDCIFYVTLYYILSRKHGIMTSAFSIMPNHTHSLQTAPSKSAFLSFNQELNAKFTRAYNEWHCRLGPLFQAPFGSAPKMIGKKIKSSIIYICNNASAGKLSQGIIDYRWNLMAYYDSCHPFAPKIVLAKASCRLRRAIKLVDYYSRRLQPIDYPMLARLTQDLTATERNQLTDYIISHYDPLNYSELIICFGSYEKALLAMTANSGSEHDIKEDWDDYSIYTELSRQTVQLGYSLSRINFEAMPLEEIERLISHLLRNSRASCRQVEKYLHVIMGSATKKHGA